MLKDFTDEYARYRAIGEKALRQVPGENLNAVIGTDNNSIAVIVRHISGNLLSRFTDFLTTDGEKTWRDRDSEFEDKKYEAEDVEKMWAEGWRVLETQLSMLTDEHLQQTVYIRGQAWTVHEALCRSLAHVSYHVGQIVVLARIFSGGNWDWISIPKGQSREYNTNPTMEKKPEQ
ncbi:MAG TPA: DinB family protein [Blastocatellia bacterium]|nr:DinB family protein [Blastocatellia bacterium]